MKILRNCIIMLLLIFTALPLASCGDRYADGVYEGEYSFIKVQAAVKDGRMTDIKMLHHGGGGKEYAGMVTPLLAEMVKKQSTGVDAVTGATVSSRNLTNAVKDALEKAKK